MLLLLTAGWFAHQIQDYLHSPIAESDVAVDVVIESGSSFDQAAAKLKDANIIAQPFYFKLLALYEDKTQSIKSGEYRFYLTKTPAEILDVLVTGKTMQHSITVIEGKTYKDFLAQLSQHEKIESTDSDLEAVKTKLGITHESLEGLFLPETYHFTAGAKDIDILQQSYTLLRDLLDMEWPKRSEESFVKSPYEALILASIVEKETGVAEERPRIAGVFISRLNKNMRLQTDPTIIYGLGDEFDGNITRKHLETDNPYNTYTRSGLPPTPIALPSKAAIMAVLHPDITGELFFVSKGDGTHYFSKTYEEHNAAVRKYQLGK